MFLASATRRGYHPLESIHNGWLGLDVQGSSRWKLSSVNLYTFIRPNKDSCEKCNYRFHMEPIVGSSG
jgi:hypothetical protein